VWRRYTGFLKGDAAIYQDVPHACELLDLTTLAAREVVGIDRPVVYVAQLVHSIWGMQLPGGSKPPGKN
jgi:hypothetical protein